MAGFKDAAGYRRFFKDISSNLVATASTDDTTLVTVRNTSHIIYIQRIIAFITTDAAVSWSFEDSNSSAKQIAEIPASPGDSTRWDFDFGDEGVPLTLGKNFVLNVSAAGLAGHIEWQGYEKLGATVAVASA